MWITLKDPGALDREELSVWPRSPGLRSGRLQECPIRATRNRWEWRKPTRNPMSARTTRFLWDSQPLRMFRLCLFLLCLLVLILLSRCIWGTNWQPKPTWCILNTSEYTPLSHNPRSYRGVNAFHMGERFSASSFELCRTRWNYTTVKPWDSDNSFLTDNSQSLILVPFSRELI